jgi:hypothetical protein
VDHRTAGKANGQGWCKKSITDRAVHNAKRGKLSDEKVAGRSKKSTPDIIRNYFK